MVLWSENHMFDLLHKVYGAVHAQGSTVEHMGVDHGGAHILMAQQFLDHTDILAALQQVRGKGWIDVVPAIGSILPISAAANLRNYPFQSPL